MCDEIIKALNVQVYKSIEQPKYDRILLIVVTAVLEQEGLTLLFWVMWLIILQGNTDSLSDVHRCSELHHYSHLHHYSELHSHLKQDRRLSKRGIGESEHCFHHLLEDLEDDSLLIIRLALWIINSGIFKCIFQVVLPYEIEQNLVQTITKEPHNTTFWWDRSIIAWFSWVRATIDQSSRLHYHNTGNKRQTKS